MAQPFRNGNVYESAHGQHCSLLLKRDRIEAVLPLRYYMLSSAVLPGGFSWADRIVNWKVPLDYQCDDPVRDLTGRCAEWDCDPRYTIGLITAAKLTHASVAETEGDGFKLLVCTSVGTRNAARAGLPRSTYSAYTAGTINMIVLIDGRMTEAAMVNAVITATEAKSAALQQLGIVERLNGEQATGTTTDAIVIGVSQTEHWSDVHAYAGAATTIGCAIGEAAYKTVLEAGGTQHEE